MINDRPRECNWVQYKSMQTRTKEFMNDRVHGFSWRPHSACTNHGPTEWLHARMNVWMGRMFECSSGPQSNSMSTSMETRINAHVEGRMREQAHKFLTGWRYTCLYQGSTVIIDEGAYNQIFARSSQRVGQNQRNKKKQRTRAKRKNEQGWRQKLCSTRSFGGNQVYGSPPASKLLSQWQFIPIRVRTHRGILHIFSIVWLHMYQ